MKEMKEKKREIPKEEEEEEEKKNETKEPQSIWYLYGHDNAREESSCSRKRERERKEGRQSKLNSKEDISYSNRSIMIFIKRDSQWTPLRRGTGSLERRRDERTGLTGDIRGEGAYPNRNL